jgi:TPP-dependent trihydroxycyclohexane-1,2-dione (THcHDO) dehydratase
MARTNDVVPEHAGCHHGKRGPVLMLPAKVHIQKNADQAGQQKEDKQQL